MPRDMLSADKILPPHGKSPHLPENPQSPRKTANKHDCIPKIVSTTLYSSMKKEVHEGCLIC